MSAERDHPRLTSMERTVLGWFVEASGSDAGAMRSQVESAEVVGRSCEPGKRGMGVDFEVPEWVERLARRGRVTFADVSAEILGDDGSSIECQFLLHLNEGVIVMLEGLTSGAWPTHARLGRHWHHRRGTEVREP